jgi:hypothetical protein
MERLQPKIGLATLASPYEVGADKSEDLHRRAIKALAGAGLQVVSAGRLVDSDEEASLHYCVADQRTHVEA